MKIVADTNVLLRAVVRDDLNQLRQAQATLDEASLVAITMPTLCEFAWVLRRSYRHAPHAIAAAIRALMQADNVITDRQTLEDGLAMLDAGGDFADGVIASEGRSLGGDTFVSFDKDAVKRLATQGIVARLLA